jgi:hypothetical protein
MNYLEIFRSLDPSLIALTIMTVLVVATVVSWHRNKPGFDLSQCIVDSTTNRIAAEKVGFMVVLAVMSWGFVALVLQHQLSEWYATAYGGIFVLGRFGSQMLSVKKDIATGNTGPTP